MLEGEGVRCVSIGSGSEVFVLRQPMYFKSVLLRNLRRG